MSNLGKRNSNSVTGSYHTKFVRASMHESSCPTGTSELSAMLLRAAMIGDIRALTVLLDRCADVNARDEHGRTVLMEAVFGGDPYAVNLLIDHGADTNAADKDGWTALMEASSKGRYNIAKELISKGADPTAKSKDGWTALKSVARGHFKLARLLRDAGATE